MKVVSKPVYLLSQFDKENLLYLQTHSRVPAHLLHFHDCYEIAGFISGNGVHHLNGKDMIVTKNDVFVLTPKDYHSFYNLTTNNCFFNIMFSKNLLTDKIKTLVNSLKLKHLTVSSKSMHHLIALHEVFLSIKQQKDITHDNSFYQNFLELFLTIIHSSSRVKETSISGATAYDTAFTEIISYINDHFSEELTLKKVANDIGYSYTYLSKLFLKKTNVEFNTYVNSLKIEKAKSLLLKSSDSMLFVCHECGYASMTSFLRNFKTFTGLTPTAFVKKYKY